ncbi:hypothetical protein RHSIM_Rhsim13G0048600 [Rhododendron simsii]|uniref:TF-B3 domain-containing protein n=1 Tax=Rhododendron simsii TaxID=118357 RepID=A0A834G0C1_RHOSS|nr:hypothetical protein RHSIM_Rhsim13G0048600 [Rhododendron simsii]
MSDNRRRIGTGREGNESLEGHASSSSQMADTGTQIPEEESELGSAISRRPVVSGTHTKVGEKMGSFQFEVLVTPGDVKLNKLLIPVEAALKCFPPLADCQETFKKKIKISDPQNVDWPMTLRYDPSECFFILENMWQIFAVYNNVETLDTIRFYKPVPRSDDNHYLVETVKRSYENTIHEFKNENFMFELLLTDTDIQFQVLFICDQDVFKHFSEVGIPDGTHDIERLYFTDDLNVHFWDIKIRYHRGFYLLMLADFFTEYNLGKGDMISFYRPVHPLHSRHFLIAFVKGGSNGTQSETASDDTMVGGSDGQGDGGEGGMGRGSNRQGDGRGRSHSGGRKWWKLGFGCCCFPAKSYARIEISLANSTACEVGNPNCEIRVLGNHNLNGEPSVCCAIQHRGQEESLFKRQKQQKREGKQIDEFHGEKNIEKKNLHGD